MSGSTLVGTILIAVGVVDLIVGILVILPRVAEESRAVLRMALISGALLAIVLGILFLTGVLGA